MAPRSAELGSVAHSVWSSGKPRRPQQVAFRRFSASNSCSFCPLRFTLCISLHYQISRETQSVTAKRRILRFLWIKEYALVSRVESCLVNKIQTYPESGEHFRYHLGLNSKPTCRAPFQHKEFQCTRNLNQKLFFSSKNGLKYDVS